MRRGATLGAEVHRRPPPFQITPHDSCAARPVRVWAPWRGLLRSSSCAHPPPSTHAGSARARALEGSGQRRRRRAWHTRRRRGVGSGGSAHRAVAGPSPARAGRWGAQRGPQRRQAESVAAVPRWRRPARPARVQKLGFSSASRSQWGCKSFAAPPHPDTAFPSEVRWQLGRARTPRLAPTTRRTPHAGRTKARSPNSAASRALRIPWIPGTHTPSTPGGRHDTRKLERGDRFGLLSLSQNLAPVGGRGLLRGRGSGPFCGWCVASVPTPVSAGWLSV